MFSAVLVVRLGRRSIFNGLVGSFCKIIFFSIAGPGSAADQAGKPLRRPVPGLEPSCASSLCWRSCPGAAGGRGGLGRSGGRGDFETEQEFVGRYALVAGAQSQGGAEHGIFGVGGAGVDVAIEVGFLDAPNSSLPPAGRDDGFHQNGLGGRAGLMFVQEFIEQLVELGGIFLFQDKSVGEHTVAGAVAGGIALALGGDGSS